MSVAPCALILRRVAPFVHTFKESHASAKVQESTTLTGWTTSYVVADILKMPHGEEKFLTVLSQLPTEAWEKWSETDPVEAAYRLAKLPRPIQTKPFANLLSKASNNKNN